MKLKCRPEDFRVRERMAWEPSDEGRFGIYQLTKHKLSTFEALHAVARAAAVPLAEIGYGGLKDRQALASQLVSIPGPPRRLRLDDVELRYLGRSQHPIERARLEGNEFDIVVRDLDAAAADRLRASAEAVRRFGVPNYFDSQRFECMLPGRRFVARSLLEGRWESALREFLVGDPQRRGKRHETADYLARHWGEWARCAARFSRRRSAPLLRYLAQFPQDPAGAFAYVNPDLFRLHLYAYQSYIWNLAVGTLVERVVPREARLLLPYTAGVHVCFRGLDSEGEAQLRAADLPLPDHRTRPGDALSREALQQAFKAVGLPQAKFRLRWPPGDPAAAGPRPTWEFRQEPRPLLVVPRHLQVSRPRPDSLHARRLQVRVRFTLPPGSYATLVLKRLAEDATLFDAPPRPRRGGRDAEQGRKGK